MLNIPFTSGSSRSSSALTIVLPKTKQDECTWYRTISTLLVLKCNVDVNILQQYLDIHRPEWGTKNEDVLYVKNLLLENMIFSPKNVTF